MDNIQFCHKHRNQIFNRRIDPKRTYACLVPSKDVFLEVITPGLPKTFITAMGVAYCSDEDNYVKKVGRNLALSRMELVEFQLDRVDFYNEDRANFWFKTKEHGAFCFQVNTASERVYFLGK